MWCNGFTYSVQGQWLSSVILLNTLDSQGNVLDQTKN